MKTWPHSVHSLRAVSNLLMVAMSRSVSSEAGRCVWCVCMCVCGQGLLLTLAHTVTSSHSYEIFKCKYKCILVKSTQVQSTSTVCNRLTLECWKVHLYITASAEC